MDEQLFDRLAADVLRNLDSALMTVDGVDVDLGGDVLSIEFADGATYVVNSHRAARQIWLAADLSAAHYSLDESTGEWRDSKTGTELHADLGALLSRKLGKPVELRKAG